MPRLVVIAAVERGLGIGRGNELLWREPEDQRRFRALTLGHPVVMGRKTWDSLPARFRPLPGRRNIVVTRQAGWQAEGAEAAASLHAALALAGPVPQVFVIGGGQLYAEALPLADTLLMTEIDAALDADTYFPEYRSRFREVQREARVSDGGVPYAFVTYQRR
jgi:dihydrofolate reductase